MHPSLAPPWQSYEHEFRPLPDGADTIAYLALEDADRLQSAGFYLDRRTWPKHLTLGFTKYGEEVPRRLCEKLDSMMSK